MKLLPQPINPKMASNIIRIYEKLLALSLKGKKKKRRKCKSFFLTTKRSGNDFPLFVYLDALNRFYVKKYLL